AEAIYEVVDPNANIIFGAVIDDRLQGEVRITVIATGFTGEIQAAATQNVANPRVTATPKRSTPQSPAVNPPTPVAEPTKEKTGLDIPDFLRNRRTPRN
ncbi:MAG: cell division protein FtsZ, partial [Nodularia sp. (in: cyanobacteria)]|nr:cell division protein FtsZ [Nodularia sp. (in: cyanobacteria)]